MTYAIENITASQAAARRAERLRGAAELLSRADPGRLTYSAGTAQFWPTPDRNALLSATLEPPPLVHQMALAPGPEGVARCGEPNPVWPAGRAQVTCPRCFTLIAARTDART